MIPRHLLARQDEETLAALAAAGVIDAPEPRPRNEREHEEQVALFQWADMQVCVHPELEYLFAVPNGGLRDVRVARKLKAEGVKAGVLDVWLPVPRRPYHGFVCEMKWGKNTMTDDQARWAEFLREQGYYVCVCYSWSAARDEILAYLALSR